MQMEAIFGGFYCAEFCTVSLRISHLMRLLKLSQSTECRDTVLRQLGGERFFASEGMMCVLLERRAICDEGVWRTLSPWLSEREEEMPQNKS